MATGTLTFNLPEEHMEHRQAVMAGSLAAALDSHAQWLRNEIKHNPSNRTPEAIEALEAAQKEFWDTLGEMNLTNLVM